MSWIFDSAPDAVSFTSNVKDVIISRTGTEDSLNVKITVNSNDILDENYIPDNDGKIYIRGLGRLFKAYLSGASLGGGVQNNLVLNYKFKFDDVEQVGEYAVMLCDYKPKLAPQIYQDGNVFLHIMGIKRTIPTAPEYLSAAFTSLNERKVKAFVTTFNGVDYENSNRVVFATEVADKIKTLNISFNEITPLFPTIDPEDIVAYRIELPNEIAVYMIDRETYLQTLHFRFKNSFHVSETITTRGDVTRARKSSFEIARIGGIDHKYDIDREDEFSVNSGKIFSLSDYERLSEMFNSEEVEVFFLGEWIKVIVEENEFSEPLRLNSLQQRSFKFYFADPNHNNLLIGGQFAQWILSDGKWTDEYMWIDSGHWNDGN